MESSMAQCRPCSVRQAPDRNFPVRARSGSHWLAIESSRISAECPRQARDDDAARATNVAKRRSKLPICLTASSRSVPAGSPCAVSRNLASNRASSFNSSVPGTLIAHWLTLGPHRLNAVSFVECVEGYNNPRQNNAASEGREYL